VELGVREPRRGDVFLVSLEPARGREIRKTRPCLIVSPDELNAHLPTFLAAPLTTGGHPYPFRIPCRFRGRDGFVVLDQLRTLDRSRLVRRLGRVSAPALRRSLEVLREMFEE
jgi:mRNA interferase MazF